METISKRNTAIVTVTLAVMTVATLAAATSFSSKAFAFGGFDNGYWGNGFFGSNFGDQSIDQGQFSNQDSQCDSGDITALSCNNVDVQNSENFGHNALGQR